MALNERWRHKGDSLVADIKCDDFISAVGLIQKIAGLAEVRNHHPDILLRNYNRLTIILTTHDSGSVTDRDEELAAAIDKLLS